MRKKIVTIAIGKEFEGIESISGLSRQKYAAKYKWEYEVIRSIPDYFRKQHRNLNIGELCNIYKLHLPVRYQNYDLIAFMDVDTIISEHAPCLSLYTDKIPIRSFAAANTIKHEDRKKFFPQWEKDYYTYLETKNGLINPLTDRTKYINAGVLLFKPHYVLEDWNRLINIKNCLNEENRLNAYEMQAGKCFILPNEWNLLWMYEKYRKGILKPEHNKLIWIRNIIYNRFFGRIHEKREIKKALDSCYILHAAFEHRKLYLLK